VRTWVVVVVDVEMTPEVFGEVVVPPGRIEFPTNWLPFNATLAPSFASTAERPSKSAKVHPTDAFLSKFECNLSGKSQVRYTLQAGPGSTAQYKKNRVRPRK
jgi:hypothetical protein